MTKNQSAAYIYAQTVAANIEAMGMAALNQYRIDRNETVAYTGRDFTDLIDKYELGYNTIIMFFQNHCDEN